jgi:hypothetical protein
MQYHTLGGILEKAQQHDRSGGGVNFRPQNATTYTNAYTYGRDQPNAPQQIGEYAFSYDANGNQLSWKDNTSGQQRDMLWDSLSRFIGKENRLRSLAMAAKLPTATSQSADDWKIWWPLPPKTACLWTITMAMMQ